LGLVLLLLAMGLANLYSASAPATGGMSAFFKSQLVWIGIGLSALAVMLAFHYRILLNLALPVYLLSLVFLILVIVMGKSGGGQKNWLILGGFRMQPAEFAKLSVILMLAKYFHCNLQAGRRPLHRFFKPILIVGVPLALILVQKDVGSALFFLLIGMSACFVAGMKLRVLASVLVLMLVAGGVGYRYFLSDYQRGRIQTFLHPEKDPRGRGYHLLQSKIAVGSGGAMGKGFLKGDLNKFKFLPERHTDFVFPVLAEEWGFLGATLALASLGALLFLLLQAAGKARDAFGGFIVLGVTVLLFWQTAVNLGGVLGLMPLAGVTLPFFSYGGSALLVTLLGIGLAMNVYMRRYVF
jgi:rod shape-determining protein RodA